MSVKVRFECDGCFVMSDELRIRSEFRSFCGRSYGFGSRVEQKASEVTPPGWVAFDPYTGCCYCPECWHSIGEAESA